MPPRKKTEPKPKAEDQVIDNTPKSEFSEPVNPGITDEGEFRGPEMGEPILDEVNGFSEPDPEPDPVNLEPLELEDLVDDSNRVRMALNTFPVDIGEDTKARLYIMAVPGEEGTFAATWFKNSPTGPVQAVPVRRISNWNDNSFNTEDGQSFTYTTSAGCKTCGNRLVTYRPWGGHVRVTLMSRQR